MPREWGVLTDGRIYIRADGETREAKSEEVDLLIQRGLSGAVEVDFGVEVLGDITPVTFDKATTVDEYISREKTRLISALPRKEPAPRAAATSVEGLRGVAGYRDAFAALSTIGSDPFSEPEDRTEEEYLKSIDHWEHQFRSAWGAALSKIAASQLVPAIVRVTNRTTTFFHDVEVKLHLEGPVFAFDYTKPEWADDFSDLELPSPPRTWGPRKRSFGIPTRRASPTLSLRTWPRMSRAQSTTRTGLRRREPRGR